MKTKRWIFDIPKILTKVFQRNLKIIGLYLLIVGVYAALYTTYAVEDNTLIVHTIPNLSQELYLGGGFLKITYSIVIFILTVSACIDIANNNIENMIVNLLIAIEITIYITFAKTLNIHQIYDLLSWNIICLFVFIIINKIMLLIKQTKSHI